MGIMRPIPTRVAAELINKDSVHSTLETMEALARKGSFKLLSQNALQRIGYLPGAKKTIQRFIRSCTGIEDAVFHETISLAAGKKDSLQALAELKSALDDMIASSEKPRAEDFSDLPNNAFSRHEKTLTAFWQRLNRTGVAAGYVPLLLATKPGLSVDKCKARGIACEGFAEHALLSKQLVFAISWDFVKSQVDGDINSPKFKKAAEEFRQDALETFLARHRASHMQAVSNPFSWKGATVWWVMPSGEYKILKTCTWAGSPPDALHIKRISVAESGRGK